VVGNAGILVTKVLYVKETGKKFVICDSGMNHLIRPSLYGSYHRIWPVETDIEKVYIEGSEEEPDRRLETVDVVGPICESGDFFAQDRLLPPVKRGDCLAIFSAGAYGMTMSSHYNGQPGPAEVVVEGEHFSVVRTRETYEDLIRGEDIPGMY
jgi:diaminopimelate decarboxylase